MTIVHHKKYKIQNAKYTTTIGTIGHNRKTQKQNKKEHNREIPDGILRFQTKRPFF